MSLFFFGVWHLWKHESPSSHSILNLNPQFQFKSFSDSKKYCRTVCIFSFRIAANCCPSLLTSRPLPSLGGAEAGPRGHGKKPRHPLVCPFLASWQSLALSHPSRHTDPRSAPDPLPADERPHCPHWSNRKRQQALPRNRWSLSGPLWSAGSHSNRPAPCRQSAAIVPLSLLIAAGPDAQ